jgi:phage terminase large subunit
MLGLNYEVAPNALVGAFMQPTAHADRLAALQQQLYTSLTDPQRTVYDANTRFTYLCSGRRFGKTYLSLTRLINWGLERPGGLFYYVAPTYRMAKQIAWVQLKQMVPPEVFDRKNETELSVHLANGSTIYLKGAEDPDRLRGISLSGCVIDEAAYVREDAWTMVLRPALSDQQGPAWFTTTPAGLNWFAEAWDAADDDPQASCFTFNTLEGGQVSADEIEAARRTLDPRTFSQEYEASFVNLVGRVVPDFNDDNIRDDLEDLGGELIVCADFNVSPMHWIIGQKVGNQFHAFDEIHIRETHTDEAASELLRRYPDRTIRVYPDPTGHARKTSAGGKTDHGILRQRGLWVSENKRPYMQDDKRNAINAMVCDANGNRRLFIHPRCKQTIKSLRNLTFKDGTNMPDKESGHDHGWDALSYGIIGVYDPVAPWKASAGKAVRNLRLY